MKKLKSYFTGIEDNSKDINNILLVMIQFIYWIYFAVLHFNFFKNILYITDTYTSDLGEIYVLKFHFPLNRIIFGGIIFTVFQLFRVFVNYLTKHILFSKGANYKFSLRLILIYLYVLIILTVSFSSAIILCSIFFSNEVQLFLENNYYLFFHEVHYLGYLNPIVNSLIYYMKFIVFIFERVDFTIFVLLIFVFNLFFILLPFVTKIEYLKLKKTQRNESNLDQITIFGAIQHELGNKLPTLKIDLEALFSFLNQEPTSFDSLIEKPIRKQEFAGDYVESVRSLFERIFAKVDYCINAISSLNGFINADPNKYSPEKVKLIDFFEQEAIKYIQNQPNITLEFIGNRSVEANIDKKQFSYVLLSYTLKFIIEEHTLSEFNGKFSKTIKILNNGNPFPKNIKKEEYKTALKYGGNTGNSGYGGFLISKIIENHSGDFDIFVGSMNAENFGVGIIIYLP